MALPKMIFPGSHPDAGDGDLDFEAWSKLVANLEYLDGAGGNKLDVDGSGAQLTGVVKSIAGVSKANPTLQDIGAAATGHTPLSDTNYQVSFSDVDVAFTALTAPRVVKLCDVDTYPLGQDLVIGDESGACSATITITILVGDGTSDTIPQQSDGTIVLAYPFASVRLRRGAANIWKIV